VGISEQDIKSGRLPNVASLGPDDGPLKGFESVRPGGSPSEEQLAGGSSTSGGPVGDAVRGMAEDMQREEAVRGMTEEMRREEEATRAAGLEDVFFTFDSWQLSEQGKQMLVRNAEWLKADPARVLRVEGHCDERGTNAYNIELGRKRANAVWNYLSDLGVQTSQIRMTSYGKTRPFCTEHDESCYQQNRRGHMVVTVK
jgi:peptidoglycan-associated lipoprotein